MIVDNLKDKDIVAYLSDEDAVKFGVVKLAPQRAAGRRGAALPATNAVTVSCLTKDADGFWVYKDPAVEVQIDRGDVVMNMTEECSVMGKTGHNIKKVKIIVPSKLIGDLKILKEELKVTRRRSRSRPLQVTTSDALEELEAMAEETMQDNIRKSRSSLILDTPVTQQWSGVQEFALAQEPVQPEVTDDKIMKTRARRKPSPKKKATDSDPEVASVDDETKAKIEEKISNLEKRPPRKTKKQIALEKQQEALREQEARERKLRAKNALRFARNTSTNLRFDPLRLGLGMISKNDKQDDVQIERKFTNELDFNPDNVETITLIDMLNAFTDELKESKNSKPIKFKLLSSVPSKSELDNVLAELSQLSDWLAQSTHFLYEDKQLAEQAIKFWQICFKFLNSLDTSIVYNIKDDLIAEKTSVGKEDDDCKMERICYDLRQVMFMLNSLVVHMDDLTLKNFYVQKASLLCCLFDIEAKSSMMTKMFLQYYMQMVDALNVNDECGDLVVAVTQKILNNVNFALDFKSVLEADQLDPLVYMFINLLKKNQLKISSKYWTVLVTAAAKVIEQQHPGLVTSFIASPERVLDFIDMATKQKNANLEKAFVLAAIKLALTTGLVDSVVEAKPNKKIIALLKDLTGFEEYLPYFVCFYQALASRTSSIDEIRAKKIIPINTFIARFLSRTEEDILHELKVKVMFCKELEQNWSGLNELLQSKEDSAASIDEVIRCLNKPNGNIQVEAHKGKRANNNGYLGGRNNDAEIYETVSSPVETYMFWVNLINEVYLPNILSKPCETTQYLRKAIQSNKAKIEKQLSREDRLFLLALANNFEQFPAMSLQPGMEHSEVRIRVVIAHMMAQFMLMKNENDFLSLSSKGAKELFQRDQLCAMPGEDEEKYRVIAQMIYDKEYNMWNSAYNDITSLNQCSCGYYYFIGNCGRPYQEYSCPECKKAIGGLNHQYAAGKQQMVSNKDFLKMYGKLEKKSAKMYVKRNLSNVDYSVSMRLIVGTVNFKLIEMMTHARYMLEMIVGTDNQQKGLLKMLTLTKEEAPEYLMDFTVACFKPAVHELKSEVKAFNWMNCLARSLSINNEQLNFNSAKRNMYEQQLSKKITHFLTNKEEVLKSVFKKAYKEDNERAKRLVYNWVNSSVAIEEFKACFPGIDLRIITAMKSISLVDTKNIDLLGELTKIIGARYTEPAMIPLIKFALQHNDLLNSFRQITSSILELSTYLSQKLDCSITWKEACTLSIADLTKSSDKMMKDEDLEHIINKYGSDHTLKTLFDAFCQQWPVLMQLKDKYPQQLSFRFMCHGNILSDQTIEELVDPSKAKVAYFLVTESNVESLIINSLLQTLAAFQSNLLTSHTALFQAINGNKPLKMPLQSANATDLVELSDFKDLVASCAKFAKDSDQVDFNVELLERQIAAELFIGKSQLIFVDNSIQHFNVKFDFGQTFTALTSIGIKVEQVPIPADLLPIVEPILKKDPEAAFTSLQKLILSMHKRSSQVSNLEHLPFVEELSSLSDLTASHLKDLFERLEAYLFKKTARQVDVLFQADLSSAMNASLRSKLVGLPNSPLLFTAVQRFVQRQVLNSNSEKLAATDLRMALEFADVWLDDAPEHLLEVLEGLTVAQALSFAALVPSITN